MADRYWVGGNGTWNNSSTANWSTSSGGPSGASVPTTADDVFFDNNSGATNYTVTLSGTGLQCRNLNMANATTDSITLAGSGPTITCAGSLSFRTGQPNPTVTSCDIIFTGTGAQTITWAGVTTTGISLTFNNAAGSWTFQDALSFRTWTFTAGTINTNNFAVTCFAFASSGSAVRNLTLGTSTVSITTNTWSISNATNFTLSAASSTIQFSGTGGTNQFANLTYGDVNYLATAGTASSGYILGSGGTFANMRFAHATTTSTTVIKTYLFSTGTTTTVTGTFGTTGSAPDRRTRILMGTNTPVMQNTIASTISAATYVFTDVNFYCVALSGAGAPASGTSLGDGGMNSGITFTAAKTVYWVGGTAAWASGGWATGSGGGASLANWPLPQDTVIIDNSSGAAGMTVTLSSTTYLNCTWSMLDMSLRTTSMTLAWNSYANQSGGDSGGFKHGSGVSYTGTANIAFAGSGTFTYAPPTSTTLNFNLTLVQRAPGAKTVLANNYASTGSSHTVTLAGGEFDLGGRTFQAPMQIVITGPVAQTKSLRYNGGTINMLYSASYTSGNIQYTEATNFSVADAGTVNFSGTAGANNSGFTSGSASEAGAIGVTMTANFTGRTFSLGSGGYGDLNISGLLANSANFAATNVYGDLVMPTPANVPTWTAGTVRMAATSGTHTITTNGAIGNATLSINGVGGTFNLVGDWMSSTTTGQFQMYGGSFNMNGNDVWCAKYDANSGNVRSLTVGSGGGIYVNGSSGVIVDTLVATNLTINDQANYKIYCTYAGSVGTRTIYGISTGADITKAAYIYVTAGSDILSYLAPYFLLMDHTGFTGTAPGTISAAMIVMSATATYAANGTWTLLGDVGATYTINPTRTWPGSITRDGVNTTATWQLGANVTCTGQLNWHSSRLLPNGFTFQCATLSLSSSTARELDFTAGGKITVTGNNTTVFTWTTATALTITGTSNIEFTYAGSVGTRTFSGSTPANIPDTAKLTLKVNAGTDILSFGNLGVPGVDLRGFTGSTNAANQAVFVNGDCWFDTGFTNTYSTRTFAAGSTITQNLSSGGVTWPATVLFGATGLTGTVRLADAFTTNALTQVTRGTWDTNNFTVTTSQDMAWATSAAATVNLGTSQIVSSFTTTTGNNIRVDNLLTLNWSTGAKISFTNTGTGTKRITTSNNTSALVWPPIETTGVNSVLAFVGIFTLQKVTNLTQPLSVQFAGTGSTFYINEWGLNGTAGNLVTVTSTGSSNHSLISTSSANRVGNYLSVNKSSASGPGTFYAVNSTNAGSNTGWVFGSPPASTQGNMFFLFNWA